MKSVPFKEIVGPTYTMASLNAECQRCMNLQPEIIESGAGVNTYYLRETPGLLAYYTPNLTTFPTLVGKNVTGMHLCANGRFFITIYDKLIELKDVFGVATVVNSWPMTIVASDQPLMQMNDNSLGLFIMRDRSGTANPISYSLATFDFATGMFYDFHDTVGLISTKYIEFLDSYFLSVSCTNGTGIFGVQYQFSPVTGFPPLPVSPIPTAHPASDWDALLIASAESSPDLINAICVNGREIWVFGVNSYEVHYNAGTSALDAFQRISGAAYPIGCLVPGTVRSVKSSVLWLGSNTDGYGIVFMSQGLQGVRVSNTAIERMIRALPILSDAYSWSYQLTGHTVYVLTFPTSALSIAYDLDTGLWHELSYRNPANDSIYAHKGHLSTFAFGKNLVTDYSLGIIYQLSETTYTDNGDPIVRYRRAPVVSSGNTKVFHLKLDFEMEFGVGTTNPNPGNDPKLYVRWSDDNGHTWGYYREISMGKQGEYDKQMSLNRLGAAKKRVYEVYCSDPVPFRLISAMLGVESGLN